MIDWQVRTATGEQVPGWDDHRDGCAFPDFDHQEYLLPYFNVGDTLILPYEGADFSKHDLLRLANRLRIHRPYFESRLEPWTITESSGGQEVTIRLDRNKVLALLDKTLSMIDFALAENYILVFYGD